MDFEWRFLISSIVLSLLVSFHLPSFAVAGTCKVESSNIGDCVLTGEFRAIEFGYLDGDQASAPDIMITLERDDQTQERVSLRKHLEEVFEDSDSVLAHFEELTGARYEVPRTIAEIKAALGFDSNVQILAEDWIEVLRVDIERSLSVDTDMSGVIVDLLGLDLLDSSTDSSTDSLSSESDDFQTEQ